MWELIKFFREKFLEIIEINSDEAIVSEFIYNMIKKVKFGKEKSELNGFLVFNTVFGLNIAKEVKMYSKYLYAIFARAHREKFIKYEVLLSLEYKLCKYFS